MVHRGEKLLVVVREVHLFLQELHRFHRGHVREILAQNPRAVHHFARQQQVFAAGTRRDYIDGRIYALVGQLAVELKLHVTRAFELFEDHLVHLRTGVDQGCGDDCQRAFLFRVAGRAEETLRFVQRVGIHTAREHLARSGLHREL